MEHIRLVLKLFVFENVTQWYLTTHAFIWVDVSWNLQVEDQYPEARRVNLLNS